jgi:hypothetical protein
MPSIDVPEISPITLTTCGVLHTVFGRKSFGEIFA